MVFIQGYRTGLLYPFTKTTDDLADEYLAVGVSIPAIGIDFYLPKRNGKYKYIDKGVGIGFSLGSSVGLKAKFGLSVNKTQGVQYGWKETGWNEKIGKFMLDGIKQMENMKGW